LDGRYRTAVCALSHASIHSARKRSSRRPPTRAARNRPTRISRYSSLTPHRARLAASLTSIQGLSACGVSTRNRVAIATISCAFMSTPCCEMNHFVDDRMERGVPLAISVHISNSCAGGVAILCATRGSVWKPHQPRWRRTTSRDGMFLTCRSSRSSGCRRQVRLCCRAQVGSRSPKVPEGAERSEAPGCDRARRHNVAASAVRQTARRTRTSRRTANVARQLSRH